MRHKGRETGDGDEKEDGSEQDKQQE